MSKVLSSIVHGLETIKKNYGYFKMGVEAKKREYAKLQRIKNTSREMRSKQDQEYAEKMNKTKRRK